MPNREGFLHKFVENITGNRVVDPMTGQIYSEADFIAAEQITEEYQLEASINPIQSLELPTNSYPGGNIEAAIE